jgi:uncharacterized protein YjbI with pentapeptide repeats
VRSSAVRYSRGPISLTALVGDLLCSDAADRIYVLRVYNNRAYYNDWNHQIVMARTRGTDLSRARAAQADGARLTLAHLEGASLESAHLQGADLMWAKLQGANLNFVELQGAWLQLAELRGAWLSNAQLQGAWLAHAQLQGASLWGAQLQGAWLGYAYLWRAQLQNSVFENIFDDGGKINWSPLEFDKSSPRPWTDATYAELHQFIEREVPQGSFTSQIPQVSLRNRALERVAILDCKRRNDDTLASCDPSDPLPNAVTQWEKKIEAAGSDPNTYSKAFTALVGDLLCSDAADRIYVLRGLLWWGNFFDSTGSETPVLFKRITSPECPLSKELTDADKRILQRSPEAGSPGRGKLP